MTLAAIGLGNPTKCLFNMFTAPGPGWLITFSTNYLLTHYLLLYLELLRLVITKTKLPTTPEITAAINKPALAWLSNASDG